ncbi:hypothetical protein C9994_07735, partial [Marivirga lumbricoides]
IVYSALLIFHLSAIILISVGKNDLNFLLDLFKRMDLMMYGAYFGFLLFLIVLVFEWKHQKHLEKVEKNHSKEINELKAKLYDQKETTSSSIPPKNNPPAKDLPSSTKSDGDDNQLKS